MGTGEFEVTIDGLTRAQVLALREKLGDQAVSATVDPLSGEEQGELGLLIVAIVGGQLILQALAQVIVGHNMPGQRAGSHLRIRRPDGTEVEEDLSYSDTSAGGD